MCHDDDDDFLLIFPYFCSINCLSQLIRTNDYIATKIRKRDYIDKKKGGLNYLSFCIITAKKRDDLEIM